MATGYTLDDVDTTDVGAVSSAVRSLFREMFSTQDDRFIHDYFGDLVTMFGGRYRHYQAMDTLYHDLEHTLQATLCWVRLVANRHLLNVDPIMRQNDFKVGLLAIMMHDAGYLKEEGDTEGTGAKFTFVHEIRSCEVANVYLTEKNWDKGRIFAVQHLIACTGPRSVIDAIPFRNRMERVMGESVCVADYLGQMSDPGYLRKLPVLYQEFEESDDYRGIAAEDRMFKDYDELFERTPAFWEDIVKPKLHKECHDMHLFLSDPYPDGPNPYVDRVERSVAEIREMLSGAGGKTATG